MILSVSSFLTALVMGNLMIFIIYIFYRFVKNVYKIHYSIVMLFSIAMLFRLVVPLELAYTKTIPVSKLFPLIYDLLYKTIFDTKTFDLKVSSILIIIWAFGCLAMLVKYINSYVYLSRVLSVLQCNDLSENFVNIRGIQKNIKIVKADLPNAPFSFGLKNKYIVIPVREIEEQDLNYVLIHEMQHIKNGDLTIKFFVNIIRCIYWWNPIIYLLYSQIDYLLELRVDSIISEHWTQEERFDYINCLCSIAQNNKKKTYREVSMTFVTRRSLTLLHRVKYFIATPPKTSVATWCVIVILIVYLSFGFVFEPYRTDAKELEGTLTSEEFYNNAYIIKSNNKYELYINESFISVIDDPYSQDFKNIKIINK